MRNSFQTNPVIFKIIVLITCFMLVLIYNKSKAAGMYPSPPATYKKVAVSFTQNVATKELKVFIKADAKKIMQLYFFSVDGKLVKKISVNARQETIVNDLQKGMYLYECFDNDLKLQSGKLVLQ
jgi:hypothetical protein